MLVLAGAALVALLVVHRPPAPAGVITVSSPAPSQGFRKGHPSVASAQSIVYVVGAVRRPGLYAVGAAARVNDVILRAGGLLPTADAAAVNLAQRVTDGQEIRVLRTGESSPAPARRTRSRKAISDSAATAAIDLNAADAATLASLPGIGSTLAARIVEYRSVNGPFASLDELADVGGMTQRRIDALLPYLTLHSAR